MSKHLRQFGLLFGLLLLGAPPLLGEEAVDKKDAVTTDSIRGRVVYLADALERLYGVKSVADAKENTLVLETASVAEISMS